MAKKGLMFEELRALRAREDEPTLYEETKTKFHFVGEAKAAIAWPKLGKDAFLCALGQRTDGVLCVLAEDYEPHIDGVAERYQDYKRVWKVKYFYADKTGPNGDFAELLYNAGRSEDKRLWVEQPSISQDIIVAREIIRQCFHENRLILIREGILEEKIRELHHGDSTDPKLGERFPEIQALANVIAEFPTMDQFWKEHRPRDAWDFDDEGGSNSWMAM
jgi:hypothetical protein